MKKTLCLFAIFTCFQLAVQADFDLFYDAYLENKRHNMGFFDKISGSPYEYEEFIASKVYFKGNATPIQSPMRYNLLFDEMEFKDAKGEGFLIVDKKETIDSIIIGGETFVFLQYKIKNDSIKGFFIQLVSGNNKLYQKRLKGYTPEKQPTGGYQDYAPATIFEKPIEYYLHVSNSTPQKLPGSINGIVRFMKEKGCDLSQMVKKEKLKYNSESIVKLVNVFNFQNMH